MSTEVKVPQLPESVADATLGGEIEVPTLSGKVLLKIPAETQTGRVFRLRGKGVKALRGGATGDLLCRVVVETPVKLNKKQKQLLDGALARNAKKTVKRRKA